MLDHDGCQEFAVDCQVRLATDLIAHTWDPVVLSALRAGGRRRVDLLSAVGGMSDKVLTESLRRLVSSGLVLRDKEEGSRSVSYRLSGLGETLVDGPLSELRSWALNHGDEVLAAQATATPSGALSR